MELFDTHTHLYLPDFDHDRDEMINRSVSSGVVKLLMPNIDIGYVAPMLAAADRFKDICYPMIGLHPTHIKDDYLTRIMELEKIASDNDFIAVGETGIDLYWDKTYLKEQKDAFRKQVSWAISRSLPLVIHSRNSFGEVLSVLGEFAGEKLTGVFHAFSGDTEEAGKVIDLGFMLGIGGPVTYKNSSLPEVLKAVGPDNILTETDSPYLTPVPYRGKRNESSYISIINKKLAEIFDKGEEEMAAITVRNALKLFKI